MTRTHRFPTPAGAGLALGVAAAMAVSLASGSARAQGGTTQPSAGKARPVTQRLVFANYYYWYQADGRKAVPVSYVRGKDGTSMLTDHPLESTGPWMSYDRAQWHADQLSAMADTGIDVALAVYRGDAASRKGFALKGLDVMAQALKEIAAVDENPFAKPRQAPLIGMALDLGGLADLYGGPVDLKNTDVQRSLYGMVRDFYLHVPAEYRATVQLPPSRAGAADPAKGGVLPRGAGYLVRLIGDEAVKDADDSFMAYVDRRFSQEFGGRLVWVGTPALQAKAKGLDAEASFPAGKVGATVHTAGWVKTGSLGPGFDATSQGYTKELRPRENAQPTITEFRRMIEAGPDWVFLDSWNDYARGTEVGPTFEHGILYRDLTRAATYQFKQPSDDYGAVFLKASAPRVIAPGQVSQVEVLVQNTGDNDWDTKNLASLSYRWVKDGQYVGQPGVEITSDGLVRGRSETITIGVVAPFNQGQPLPAGEYELEINMTRRNGLESVWFSHDEVAPFRIPVTVGSVSGGRATWLGSDATTLLKRGGTYPAQVRVRNDGSEVWKKGVASIGYRWRKSSSYVKGVSEDADSVVGEGKKVLLAEDVEPGKIATLEVPFTVADASGQALAPSTPDQSWSYVLEWDVNDGQKWLAQAGSPGYREAVQVVERDPAPHFLGCSLPNELTAGKTEKVTVGIRNAGPETWKAGRDKIAVHWYYMDGTEASYNDASLPLTEDVPPFSQVDVPLPKKRIKAEEETGKKKKGEEKKSETVTQDVVLREVPVNVPYYFGPMYCVLDLVYDGKSAGAGNANKGTDILVIPVNIYSPTFTPFPLTAYANVDGASFDVARGDGNLDGRGNSFPAEFLPPYVPRPSLGDGLQASPVYPSGLWARPLNDLEGTRAGFLYPPKASGQPNMVRCEGQRVLVGAAERNRVHLLAACTDENVTADFTLVYADGSTQTRTVKFTHWNDAPKNGEKPGFVAPHRHTATGDDLTTRCYLNHYSFPVERLKFLVGVGLPRQPAIKIMALTLESANIRAGQ